MVCLCVRHWASCACPRLAKRAILPYPLEPVREDVAVENRYSREIDCATGGKESRSTDGVEVVDWGSGVAQPVLKNSQRSLVQALVKRGQRYCPWRTQMGPLCRPVG